MILVVLLALALGACTDTASPDEGRVYWHSMDEAPASLDPAHAGTVSADHVVVNLYDTLYAYRYLARPYALKPNLAAAMPTVSDDGLTVTITIKPGVRFIDDPVFDGGIGREVTAADAVYSMLRHFDPATRSQGGWLWQGRLVGVDEWKTAGADYDHPPAGVTAPDRYTLRLQLLAPYPQLVYTLAQGYSAVVPREAVRRYGPGFAQHPVGSGPFRLGSMDSAVAVLYRNPGFRREPVNLQEEGAVDGTETAAGVYTDTYGLAAIERRSPPFIDTLKISFIPDPAARWLSFTKGNEIQFAEVPAEQGGLLNDLAAGYRLHVQTETAFVFTAFNMNDPEVGYNPDAERARRNHALRCALIKAFDWDQRNERFYYGRGHIFPGVIPPSLASYDAEMSSDSITLDVDGAVRLLAHNGWTPETLPVLTYGSAGGATLRQFFEQFRGWMIRIGYPPDKIRLRQYGGLGDIKRAWALGELPLVTKAWILDYPDAQNALAVFYGPNRSPGANDANYNNSEYDRMYEQAAVMPPSPERTRLYRAMNQLIIDDCVAMTGLSRLRVKVWHKDVIAFPDAEMAGGFALRYVDLAGADEKKK